MPNGLNTMIGAKQHASVNQRSAFEFSLCLSRACLGKMIGFIYKWRRFAPSFSLANHLQTSFGKTGGQTALIERKRHFAFACAGDRSEENLSDGQTQRLSLARGFLKDAEVIMMDEPTSGENLNVFFVRPLLTLRMMILPGQARDKHRESSTQRTNTGFLLQRWTLLLRGVLSTV